MSCVQAFNLLRSTTRREPPATQATVIQL